MDIELRIFIVFQLSYAKLAVAQVSNLTVGLNNIYFHAFSQQVLQLCKGLMLNSSVTVLDCIWAYINYYTEYWHV